MGIGGSSVNVTWTGGEASGNFASGAGVRVGAFGPVAGLPESKNYTRADLKIG